MKKIRIQNDIDVSVAVYRDGAIEDLTGKAVTAFLRVGITKVDIEDFTVNGNVLSFRYAALRQKQTGVYSLTVQVADADGNVNTIDKCEVFQLVKCSCEVDGADDVNISTESMVLTADLSVESGGGEGGTYDYSVLGNKPSINGVTLSGDKTGEDLGLASADDVAGNAAAIKELQTGKQDKIAVVEHGTEDTTLEIAPNVYHVWGEVSALDITLGSGTDGVLNEYMFEFVSGSTATVLTLPDTVKWIGDNAVESNMTYQVSIVNGLAVMGGAE